MPDIQPFDYRTLSDMFDLAKQEGRTNAPSLSVFSAQAGQATGRPDLFQQGLHDSVFKRASVGIDRALEASGATSLGASIGQNVGDAFGQSDVGQSVGRSLPRSIVNFLPLAVAGALTGGVAPLVEGGAATLTSVLGAAGAGTLSGSQTYADTGSGTGAAISGLGMAVLPTVAHGAGQLALSRMGGVATDEAGHFVAQTLGQKAVEYGASQAAAQGLMQVQGELESKAEGQGFYNPLDPKHLVQSIAGQLPFTVFDLLHMGLRRPGQTTGEKVADSIAAPERMASALAVPENASEVVPEIVPPSDEQKQGTLFGKQVDAGTPTPTEEKPTRVPTDAQTGQGQLELDKQPEPPKVDPVSNATTPVTDGNSAVEKVSNAQSALTEAQAPPVNDKVLGDKLTDEVEQNGGDIDKATENVTQSVANDAVDHAAVADRAKRGRPAITDEFINQRLGTLDAEDPEDKSVLNTMQRALAKIAPQGANSTDYSRTVQRITASWLASDRDGGIQKLQGNLNRAYQNADAAPRSQPIVPIPEGVDRTDAAQMSAVVDHLNSTLPDDSNEQYKYGPSHKLADGTQSYRLYKEVKQINTGSAGLENIADTEGPQLAAIFKSEGSVGTSQLLQDVGSQFGTAMRNIDREALEDELTPFVKGATDEQHAGRADALQDQYAAYMDALTNDQDISAKNVNSKLKDQKHAFGEDEDVQDFAESPLVANVHSYLKDNVVDLDKLQELGEREMAEGRPGFADDNLYDVYGSGGQRGVVKPFTMEGSKDTAVSDPAVVDAVQKGITNASHVRDLFGGSTILSRLVRNLGYKGQLQENIYSPEGNNPLHQALTQLKTNPEEFSGKLQALADKINGKSSAEAKNILQSNFTSDPTTTTYVAQKVQARGRPIYTAKDISPRADGLNNSRLGKLGDEAKRLASQLGDVTNKEGWSELDKAKKDEFVLVDPPYVGRNRYGLGQGNITIEQRLNELDKVLSADRRGARIMYFDSYSPEVWNKLKQEGFHLQLIREREGNSGAVPEFFATNYDNDLQVLGSHGQRGRIGAGAGLDYGLEPIDENSRVGKHTVSKSGNVTEDWLRQNGGTDNQPLQKGEVELYKQLVPEAFKNGGVDLRALQEGLRTKGPVVETKVLSDAPENQMGQRMRELEHKFDTEVGPNWQGMGRKTFGDYAPKLLKEFDEYEQLEKAPPVAGTQYSFLGPKSEQNMSGYVEGLVRLPQKGSKFDSIPDADDYTPEDLAAMGVGEQPKYRGPHFGSEDKNVLAFYRGYEETLSDGTKAFHVIEVQSDWGQHQRKLQEDAKGSDNRELSTKIIGASSHPLVEDGVYQRLALKAAIAHAKEIGATKIILSDGETAMMTEGHDKAAMEPKAHLSKTGDVAKLEVGQWGLRNTETGSIVVLGSKALVDARPIHEGSGLIRDQVTAEDLTPQVSQSGGMRLAYDQTLPSALKKLTGDGGERVELGVHKGAVESGPTQNDYYTGDQTAWEQKLKEERVTGSPVFRNPDGTPKSSITGRMYDLSNVSPRASKLFGSTGERGTLNSLNEANRVKNAGLFGVRTLAGQLYKDLPPVQREAAATTLTQIALKLKQENVPVGELKVRPGDTQVGAAVADKLKKTPLGTYLLDFAQQKGTNLNDVATATEFGYAHESMHHVINALEMQQYVKPLHDLLVNATPEEHIALIQATRELEQGVPSAITKEGASRVDRSVAADETIANLGASLTLKSLEGDRGWLKDMATYLPKPVGDFLMQASAWGKKMVGAVRALAGMPEVSGVQLSPELMAAGQKFAAGLEAFSRTNQEVQQDVQKFMQLQNLDPVGFGVLQQAAQVNPLFTSGIDFDGPKWAKVAHDDISESFGLKPEKGPLGWLGSLYKRKFLLPSVDAVAHPEAKVAYGRAQDASHELVLRERELMTMMGAEVKNDGSLDVSGPKMVANMELLGNKDINQAFGDIGRMQNRGTDSGKGNFPHDEFKKLPSMAKLSPKAQDDALNLANIVWNMTRRDQEFVLDTQKRVGAESIGTVIQSMNKGFEVDKSRQLAGLLQDGVERLRSQDPSIQADGNQLLTTVRGQVSPETFNEAYQFAQNERDVWERLQQFYAGDPRFMTEQRLKNFLIKFTRADGTTDTIDRDTREDAKSAARDLTLKGMRDIGIVDKVASRSEGGPKIAPDGMLDKIRELEADRDRRISPFLSDDEKATRAAEPQIADLLQQEIAAKQMHMPGSDRRFTEGAKELNMLEGQFKYLQASLNVMGKKQIKSSVALDLMGPKLAEQADLKQRIRTQLQQVFTPDSVFGRGISKVNFYYSMAGSPATAAVIGMHPILSHMPYLVHEGAGIVGAGKQIASSAAKILAWATNGKKWANPEYTALMRSFGPELSASPLDEISNSGEASLLQAARMAKGLPPSNWDKLVANPVATIGTLSKLFFETAAKFNGQMAAISGYDFARNVKKMSILDAQRYALEFHRTVNYAGGKANRPGIFDGSIGQTAPHVLFALQRFNWGMIGMMGNYIKDARGNPNARRALVTMLGTQLAVGGAIGLPGAGVAIGILEQLFPTLQLQKNLVQGVQNMVGDDNEAGGVLSDIALHGVLNQMGIDMSSRVAFGSSFLGNRAYQGFSWQDAAGPAANVLKNAITGVGQISEGNFVKGAADLAPNALKRLINVYTNDGTVSAANGSPLLQPTTGQKFAMAIGFTPSQLSNLRQAQQIQQRAQQVQRLEVGQMTQAATQAVQQGDYTTARQIVQQYGQGDPSFDPVAALRSVAQHAVDEQNPVDVRRSNSNATGVALGLTGGAPAPSDVTRLMQRGQVEQGLGLQGQPTASDFLHAFQTDQYMRQNPTVTHQQARQAVAPPKFQTPFLFGSS